MSGASTWHMIRGAGERRGWGGGGQYKQVTAKKIKFIWWRGWKPSKVHVFEPGSLHNYWANMPGFLNLCMPRGVLQCFGR